MPRSDQYLLIENQGEAPIQGYTVLGWSSTRDSTVSGTMGQFGSGTKFAITLCLRHNLPVWVYCGKTRLEFATEYEKISDGIKTKEAYHVVCRKGAGGWKRLGWVLDWGVLDWDTMGMAVREFVSNAIDRTLREGGFDDNLLSIKTVDDADRRAKSGTTRVYIGMNDTIREYFGQLGKYFLHFSDNPDSAKPGILTKAGRCPKGMEGAVIYREGAYVRTLPGKSMYDYNFSGDQLKIDECRNSSDYHIKAAVAKLLGSADAATLSSIMRAAQQAEDLFETELDHTAIFGGWHQDPDETQKETWARAWEAAAGDDAVVCDNKYAHDFVEKKGFRPTVVKGDWGKTMAKIPGIKGADDVLNADEKLGRNVFDALYDAHQAVVWAWDVFEAANLTSNKVQPGVKCFEQAAKAGSSKLGFCKDNEVFIHMDIANGGQTRELRRVAVEMVGYYLAGDSDTDIQSLLLDALVTIAS